MSILSNLVDNAARFAMSSVVASLINDCWWVELTVSDDRPGVAAADRERIFAGSSGSTSTEAEPMAGLGLGWRSWLGSSASAMVWCS